MHDVVSDHALCSARGWLGQWAGGWGGLCFDLDLGEGRKSQKGIARGGGGAEGGLLMKYDFILMEYE